ncbi:MAG: hypothetical protein IKU39_03770 [Lachnospiraceae bacterium]|nr:hypothetical protein [Lachnospiraceae bacterium]
MNDNPVYVQEIDLKDLMFTVLRKWKVIILFAILCSMTLGGVKGFTTYKNGTSASAVEASEKKYKEELAIYEDSVKNLEIEIANITNDIAEQEEYLENSIWMRVSPYDICEARADVYITTNYTIMPGMDYQNVDYTETILQVYQSLLTSNKVKEEIAHKAGTEPRYLDELLSVSRNNSIITINMKHTSKEKAQAVLDETIMWLNDLKPQVVTMIGEHTISMINNSTSSRVGLTLADTQETQEQNLVDLKESLELKQKELDELKAPEKGGFSTSTATKSGVKFAVLGGFLGIFIVVFSVCVVFLMSDKVYSSKELKKRCGVKVLGALPAKTCKCPIDLWLNKLEGRVFEADETVRNGLIAQNIRNGLGEVKKLLVVGSANEAKVVAVAKALELEMTEITIASGGNMLKDVATLKKLPKCDGIVLVEECNVSKYADIVLEIEMAKDLEKCVLGCVVIG